MNRDIEQAIPGMRLSLKENVRTRAAKEAI